MSEVEIISATLEPTENGRSFRAMILQKVVRESETMEGVYETGYDCVRISGNCQIFANRGDYKSSFFKQGVADREDAQSSYNRHRADECDAVCFSHNKSFETYMDYLEWLEKFLTLGVKKCLQ